MPFSLLPNDIFSHLTDLTPANLQQSGIRLLMMDFDNTIVPYTTDMPTDRMLEWLSSMQQSGIALCVVSNSRKERVPLFCQRYGLSCVTGARKPFGPGILQCLSRVRHPGQPICLGGRSNLHRCAGRQLGWCSFHPNLGNSQPYYLVETAPYFRNSHYFNCKRKEPT